MAKFKAGDKVFVRKDLVVGEYYAMEDDKYSKEEFVRDMARFKGKLVTIEEVNSLGRYYVVEDDEFWSWTDEMFEGDAVMQKRDKVVVPPMQETVLVHDIAKMEVFVDRIIFNPPATIMFYRLPNYNHRGEFESWGEEKKVVAKCNVSEGDTFSRRTGVDVCLLKAIRKEADRALAKV